MKYVEFETDAHTKKPSFEKGSKLTSFLIASKLVKNEKEANAVLLIVVALLILGSFVLLLSNTQQYEEISQPDPDSLLQ